MMWYPASRSCSIIHFAITFASSACTTQAGLCLLHSVIDEAISAGTWCGSVMISIIPADCKVCLERQSHRLNLTRIDS